MKVQTLSVYPEWLVIPREMLRAMITVSYRIQSLCLVLQTAVFNNQLFNRAVTLVCIHIRLCLCCSDVIFCVVRLLFVLFYVVLVCKCVLPPGDNPIAVNKYIIYHHWLTLQCLSKSCCPDTLIMPYYHTVWCFSPFSSFIISCFTDINYKNLEMYQLI
jgi:hypothetical protein